MSMLDKIGKLLAQAEGTNNEAERDAFISKAQDLATTYSIDLELARQRQTDKTKREVPTFKRLHIGQGIAQHRARFVRLFSAIADNNNVKILIANDSTFVEPYGFPSDIDVVERLYASLSVQMVRACEEAIKAGEHKKPENQFYSEERYTWDRGWVGGKYRTDARVFRGNFYSGFTEAIRQRLYDARKKAESREVTVVTTDVISGEQDSVVTTGALVLKPREVEVHDYFNGEIKRQGIRGSWKGGSASSTFLRGAHSSGVAAGQRANLGGSRAIGGSRRAVSA